MSGDFLLYLRSEKNLSDTKNIFSVLELGFGRGGDLNRWNAASVGYTDFFTPL